MSRQLEILIDVFDAVAQRALVLPDITAGELIEEVVDEFGLKGTGHANAFSLFTKGTSGSMLDPARTLVEQGVRTGMALELGWRKRRPLPVSESLVLVSQQTKDRFQITWQPAVIGRPGGVASDAELLATNLESLPNGARISRTHAQIVHDGRNYRIVHLAVGNSTWLNGQPLNPNIPVTLVSGDILSLSPARIELEVLIQKISGKQ